METIIFRGELLVLGSVMEDSDEKSRYTSLMDAKGYICTPLWNKLLSTCSISRRCNPVEMVSQKNMDAGLY